MATIGATYPTLVDVAKRLDPKGSIDTITELLNKNNQVTQDVPFFEGNLPTGHLTTVRTGLPQIAWRAINQGVQPAKSTTVQQTDVAAEMMGYSDIDKRLVEINGNSAEFRLSEDSAFYEAFTQKMATALFYGNTAVDPEQFHGLSIRYSSLSAANARNIVNAAGSSARTSIWMVVWGASTAHMFYPKGTMAGLEHADNGLVNVTNSDGSIRPAYQTRFSWNMGLSLRDWRYCVRIANIDSSALATAGDSGYTGPNLINLLVRGVNQIENMNMGTPVIYANRTVITALDNLAQNKSNLLLGMGDYAGKQTLMFRGIPIRMTDAILNTESAVA